MTFLISPLLAQSNPAPRYANNFRTLVSSLHFTARRKSPRDMTMKSSGQWMNKQTIMWCYTRHWSKPTDMFIADVFKINSKKRFEFIFLKRRISKHAKRLFQYHQRTSNSIFFWMKFSAVWAVFVTTMALSLLRCMVDFKEFPNRGSNGLDWIRSVELLGRKTPTSNRKSMEYLQKRREGLVQRLNLVAGASEVARAPKVMQVKRLLSDCIPKVRDFRK